MHGFCNLELVANTGEVIVIYSNASREVLQCIINSGALTGVSQCIINSGASREVLRRWVN